MYGLLNKGGVFAALFALPNENGEGSSDENPIRLPSGVTAADFRSLLKVSLPL